MGGAAAAQRAAQASCQHTWRQVCGVTHARADKAEQHLHTCTAGWQCRGSVQPGKQRGWDGLHPALPLCMHRINQLRASTAACQLGRIMCGRSTCLARVHNMHDSVLCGPCCHHPHRRQHAAWAGKQAWWRWPVLGTCPVGGGRIRQLQHLRQIEVVWHGLTLATLGPPVWQQYMQQAAWW